MNATPPLSFVQRGVLVAAAAAVFASGLWPAWAVRDAVLSHFGMPAYEGVWILIPHALLYITLPAILCALLWLVFARVRWLPAASLSFSFPVIAWGILGGVIALGISVSALFASGQGSDFHAPVIDPWLMAGNLFSNFFEELIFRGFILVALAAALGFWPAAILSSLAFGAVHTQFPLALQALVALIGFIWCLVGASAKSLLAPYIAHMTLDWLIDPFL